MAELIPTHAYKTLQVELTSFNSHPFNSLHLYQCVSQLSVTVRSTKINQLIKRKGVLRLTVLEVSVNVWAHCVWACSEAEHHSRECVTEKTEETRVPQASRTWVTSFI
jgi:hypothetical protein